MVTSSHGRSGLRFVGACLLIAFLIACSNSVPDTTPSTLGTLEIYATELTYRPASLDVARAGKYMVKLINEGQVQHNVTFANGLTIVAEAGETKSAELEIPATGLTFMCSIPGHEAAGMKGMISVAGHMPPMAMGGQQHAMAPATSPQPDLNAPPSPFFDATAPALSTGTVHQLEIAVEEKEMTVAPGIVQRVWTFNGTIPAPTLRVKVGDTINVKFKNLSSNQVPHSLDYHASEVAWNDEMRTINPGEEFDITWQANYAGVWMYHCVTGPPVHHVASGMYGMVIVEPREGLPKVDREFVLIQNEWYFGPQKGLISLEKASAGAPSPDLMAFNGIPDQYVDKPLRMEKGERGRIFLLNVGPNLESSFHVVGMVFDTVIKEGVALLPGNAGRYGSQAVDLAPAQGAIVEFVAPEDGLFEFVTHTFNFHDRGAHGMIQVGDGKP